MCEDNADDAKLVKLAFRRAGLTEPIYEVSGAEEAIEYLKGEGQFGDREKFPIPRLVLTDSRMAGIGGWELVRWIRGQRALKGVSVVVFSGSDDPGDARRAVEFGADAFERKPNDFDDFVLVVRKIGQFWLRGE